MMRLTKRKVLAMAIGSAMLAACSGEPSASGDVSRETLRAIGDRFDKAQIEQNRDELERLIADDFVFVGSGGVREGKREFIDGFIDPDLAFDPIKIVDPVIVPLGPDAGIVGGNVVLSGTANGERFASRIRFADTFRRIDGEWKAVHVQATKVPEGAPSQ